MVVVVFSVAFLARLVPVIRGGGLYGLSFYDDGVHYASAAGLVHGRMPYRDFLFLHPPGIALLLAPFAELARWTSDATGLAVARIAFMVLGSFNAVLVSRFVRPVGMFGAWLGGLVYALFWPAIYSEHTILLEGPANTCLLLALLLVTPLDRHGRPSTKRLVAGGAFLGIAAGIKIWGVVPVLILCGWLVARHGIRRASLFLLGGVLGCTAVCLPFFVISPRNMWTMVVLDQIERNDTGFRLFERLNEIMGLTLYSPPARATLPLAIALAVMFLAVGGAWTHWRARPAVLLLVGLWVMLLSTPSWFVHYTALTASVIAIVFGTAGQQLLRLPWVRGRRALQIGLGAALVTCLLVGSAPIVPAKVGQKFPGPALGAVAASRPGCVTSDHPSALILMNVLSRNLERGCQLVVDLGGASYHLPSPDRGVVSRRKNAVFQVYALAYLRTGDTTILARFYKNFGLNAQSFQTVQDWPIVARAGRYALHRPQP